MTSVSATGQKQYPSRKEFKAGVKKAKTQSFGLFLNSCSPPIAEQLASARLFDWLLVDSQHSPVGTNLMQSMLTSMATHNCPSLVRVGGPGDRTGIQQALDLGAYGVMVPTVRTKEDAQKAVDAAFFPPLGSRSIAFPISPQLGRTVPDFLAAANDEVLLILQIETKESFVDNLDAILTTPGVDATFIGPFDLSFALGFFEKYGFPDGLKCQELREASQLIAARCKAAGVVAGSFAAGPDGAAVLASEGFTLLSSGTDVALVNAAAAEESAKLEAFRSS